MRLSDQVLQILCITRVRSYPEANKQKVFELLNYYSNSFWYVLILTFLYPIDDVKNVNKGLKSFKKKKKV